MDRFSGETDDERFSDLEEKAAEIRKLLLGSILLAREALKVRLEEDEAAGVVKALEEAEDAFIDASLEDRFDRLSNILGLINKRAQALFELMVYLSKESRKT